MADASSRLTIFYQAQGGSVGSEIGGSPVTPTGWTETFYSGLSDLGTLISRGQDYMKVRRSLLGVGAIAKYIRASKIPPDRTTKVYYFIGKEGVGDLFTTSPADAYDPTQVDLLCRVEALDGKRRSLWLGGIPDSQTVTLRAQGINSSFVNSAAFKSWVNKMISLQFGIRVVNHPLTNPKTFSIDTIAALTPIEVRKRDRGRPFNLYRGRRLA